MNLHKLEGLPESPVAFCSHGCSVVLVGASAGGGDGGRRDHWDVLQKLLSEGKISGPLVSDAHLAALTIKHGGTLYTTDRDFTRFPNLRFMNPLEN